MFADQPGFPRSIETAVNLLVDGEVVRTATGPNSETLDSSNWNVRDLIGKDAQIQLVDRNTGGWGHILADHFLFADQPAPRSCGAAAGWATARTSAPRSPGTTCRTAERIAIGWMSSWNYAGSIPTSPWRSAMSVPRELGPRTIDGRLQLVQRPVRELRGPPTRWRLPHRRRTIAPGATSVPVRGKALEIKADLRLRKAEHAGLKVRVGNGEETVVGYDARPARSTSTAPTRARATSPASSAPPWRPVTAGSASASSSTVVREAFADRRQTVITDQVFPRPSSAGVQPFADGERARIRSLDVWQLRSSWTHGGDR